MTTLAPLPTALLSLLLPLLTPDSTAAQDDGQPRAPTTNKKLAEWPTLKDTDKDRLLAMAGQFRKADPQLHEAARQQLIGLGEAAMPLLFQQVLDREDNVNGHLFAVFDAVLQPPHAALMARETKKPRVELRRYLTLRLCRFLDPEMMPVLSTTTKDKDAQTSFYASLGLLALKERAAVPAVLAYTKTQWKEVGQLVAEVLPRARSQDAGNWLFEAIAKAPAADQMAGLRLLRYLAVKDQTVILRTYLQASDHTVKKEAVNTMRVMNGEPPIENLTVFQSIEMAKEWLKKA